MTIEHKNISDPNRHEPKGASTASANRVYVSDGAGSGTWSQVDSNTLKGTSGDSGVSDKPLVSDGLNGFKFLDTISYGGMKIVNNAITASVTAVADTTFNTPSQFSVITGASFPWVTSETQNTVFSSDKITFNKSGIYQMHAYLNIATFPSASAKIGLRYRVNGSTNSDLKSIVKATAAGDESQIYGCGFITVNAGDYVQLVYASDTSGTLLVKDASVIAVQVR